mgnify:FL=1
METEVIRNPINRVLEIAAKQTTKREATVDLETIARDLEQVRKVGRGLFPIERDSKSQLMAIEKDLLRQQLMLESGLKYAEYPEFPMEALKWRNAKGYPRLAVFSLSSANFEIGIIAERNWGVSYSRRHTPELPRPILKSYDDVFLKLREMARDERKSMRLRTYFEGLIPVDVRQQIVETRPHFKQLFVVAEAGKWDLQKSAPIRRTDPLLVGWDAYRLWILATFDTTPIEKYIESQALKKFN